MRGHTPSGAEVLRELIKGLERQRAAARAAGLSMLELLLMRALEEAKRQHEAPEEAKPRLP
jgi:hypothetical protein